VPGRSLSLILALTLALIFGPVPAMAQQAHSSPADRARFVSVVHWLEENPVQPRGQPDRDWAIQWLTEAPDVTVNICLDSVGGLNDSYAHNSEIAIQYMLAIGVFLIQHPEGANDPNAQQVAGVAGALRAYRSILRTQPNPRSRILDGLLDTERRGGLADYIRGHPCSR